MSAAPLPLPVRVGLPLGFGLVFGAACVAHAFLGVPSHAPTTEDYVFGALVAVALGAPAGALLGLAASFLIGRHRVAGALATVAMLSLGTAAWVGAWWVLGGELIGPEDIGMVTTSWLWDHGRWGMLPLYFLSVPFDLMLIVLLVLLDAVALLVLPPTSGFCAAIAIVAMALPVVMLLARRARSTP